MPSRQKYLLDLSEYSDAEFEDILERIAGYDGFDEPVVGFAKTITVLWLSDKSIEEALGIPSRVVRLLSK